MVLYNAYNREPQTWFCVIRQISRISKSGVFKGGISPSGLSPLALYADYPFIISSYAIYIGQEKPPDGTSYFPAWRTALSTDAAGSCADSGSRNYHDSRTFVVRHDDRNESGNDACDLDDGDFSCGADVREIL